MNKDTFLTALEECSKDLKQVNLISTQIVNSSKSDESIKELCKNAKSLTDANIKRLSQLIMAVRNCGYTNI